MIVIVMETAMITPPVGINLYVVHGLRKRGKIDDVIIGSSALRLGHAADVRDPVLLARSCPVAAACRGGLRLVPFPREG